MSHYPNFETSFLIELLAHHTKKLTELFINNHFGKEYEDCKSSILELQAEIRLRQKSTETKVGKNGISSEINDSMT